MAKDEQILSGSVTFNASTNVVVDFERQIRHIAIRVATNDAYVGFDTSANTADALLDKDDYWLNLVDTTFTKLFVLGGGAGVLYYIARR